MRGKAALFLLLCVLFGFLCGDTAFAKEDHTLQFFFENVCASCHEEDEIYELFNRCISKEEKETISYEIRTYNVFLDSNKEAFEKLWKETKRNTAPALPALLIDGQWLESYDKIEENLHKVLIEGEEIPSSETAELPSVESETENSFTIPVLDAADEDKAILFFSTWSCDDCNQIKTYLKDLEEKTDFFLTEESIAEGTGVQLFKALLKVYGREEKEGKVPAVFVGTHALLGKEEIQSGLESILAEEDSQYRYLKEQLGKIEEVKAPESVNILTMFGAGLLAGFNPCSVSMLLMLFSILLTTQMSVLKNGFLYLAGKYITYFGIGFGICMTANRIDQTVLEKFGNIINRIFAVLFLIVAIMNFLDFLHVRKQEYGKIRMQLPQKLRRFNHKLLKKANGTQGALLGLVVFGLGIGISLGEFFCTGQIYMASILYTLKTAEDGLWKLMATLLVYVTAMSIPAVCILFVIQKTKGTGVVSDFMLKHMGAIKILNCVLFLLYAAYFLFQH